MDFVAYADDISMQMQNESENIEQVELEESYKELVQLLLGKNYKQGFNHVQSKCKAFVISLEKLHIQKMILY